MIRRILILSVAAVIAGIGLLSQGKWDTHSAMGTTVPPVSPLIVAPNQVEVTLDEGASTQRSITLTNDSSSSRDFEMTTGTAFRPFSAGRLFYGTNPKQYYSFPLMIVALHDDTSISVTNVASGHPIALKSDLDMYKTWFVYTPGGFPFKVESTKPIVAYHSTFTDWSHNTFFPSTGDGAYGKEHIFYLNAIENGAYAGRFYLFAQETSTVTFKRPNGSQAWKETVKAGKYRDIRLPDGAYHVVSSGRVAMQTSVENGYTLVPSTTNKGSGRQFYFAVHQGGWPTGFGVIAYDDAVVNVYDMDTGKLLYERTIAAGEYWWKNNVGSKRIYLTSNGTVEVWAGSMEGGSKFQHLGDDISFAGGRNNREFNTHSLSDGTVIFAPYDDTVVDYDEFTDHLDADDYIYLRGCCHYREIRSSKPIVVETLSSGNSGWNDVGTYLTGAGNTTSDCTWLKPPQTTDTVPGTSSKDVSITVDATGLAPGRHSCNLYTTEPGRELSPTATVFSLTVNNREPRFTSAPIKKANEDKMYSYNITTSDPDIGDIRYITALTKPAWLAVDDNGTGTAVLKGKPGNSAVGSHTIRLEVQDYSGARAYQTFTLIVINTNDAPSFTSSPNTRATEDNQYSYRIRTSDVDVDDTRNITIVRGQPWLKLVDKHLGTARLTGTPRNGDVGTHYVQLMVTDAAGAKAYQGFNISVRNTNDAPTFTSSAKTTAILDKTYNYQIQTSDVDNGDSRKIEIPVRPSWLILTDHGDGTAALRGLPTTGDMGNHVVLLTVQDKGGLRDEQEFTITVAKDVPPSGTVSGLIFDDVNNNGKADAGEGIQGARVKLNKVKASSAQNTIVTDSNGSYEFKDVPIGAYTLTISRDGYKTVTSAQFTVAKGRTSALKPISMTAVSTVGIYLPAVRSKQNTRASVDEFDRGTLDIDLYLPSITH